LLRFLDILAAEFFDIFIGSLQPESSIQLEEENSNLKKIVADLSRPGRWTSCTISLPPGGSCACPPGRVSGYMWRSDGGRDGALGCVAFDNMHGVGTQGRTLSRLNGWPMRSRFADFA
jgi:hypothetical protein